MRCIVVSDTHRHFGALEKVYLLHRDADLFIHCGDGCGDVETFRAVYPTVPLIAVSGNCDAGNSDPVQRVLELDGFRVLVVHGHRYAVKHGPEALFDFASAGGFDLVLFGHTHTPYCKRIGDLLLLNPGALAQRGNLCFATLDITEDQLIPNLCSIPEPHFTEAL